MSKEEIAELEKFHRSLRDKRQADRSKSVIAHIGKRYGVLVSGIPFRVVNSREQSRNLRPRCYLAATEREFSTVISIYKDTRI